MGPPALDGRSRFRSACGCDWDRETKDKASADRRVERIGRPAHFRPVFANHVASAVARTHYQQLQTAQNQGTGGEGNRTPVLVAIHANIYMFIRWQVLGSRTLHRHTAGSRAS